MQYDTERIKEEYHAKLVSEGYLVGTPAMLQIDSIIGKFTFYARKDKIGREKIIQIREFPGLKNAKPILEALCNLSGVKTQIELETQDRRNGKESQFDLELIATGIQSGVVNEFCTKAGKIQANYNQHRERLYVCVSTSTHRLGKTARFLMMA